MKNIQVIGAGLSGAVISRELAEAGYMVTVLEEKNHAGGHCHTERDKETGVMLHYYGPHIFHTNDERIWKFINRFGEFHPYINRVKATIGGRVYSLPVNLHTINQFFESAFSPLEAREFISQKADKTIKSPKNFEEQALSLMGEDLYKAFFYGYTRKQWGKDPKELPSTILKRLPFRFNYDDNYFNHRYQGIPKEGYTSIIENILKHTNIEVHFNETFQGPIQTEFDHTFFTGRLDSFFDYSFGRLEYRTLDFERFYPQDTLSGDYQGCAVVNYCDYEVPFTRITEHKHFSPWEEHETTVCYREYSRQCKENDIPYYPINLTSEQPMLSKYKELADSIGHVTFLGRLANYRYLDMDTTIHLALSEAQRYIGT